VANLLRAGTDSLDTASFFTALSDIPAVEMDIVLSDLTYFCVPVFCVCMCIPLTFNELKVEKVFISDAIVFKSMVVL